MIDISPEDLGTLAAIDPERGFLWLTALDAPTSQLALSERAIQASCRRLVEAGLLEAGQVIGRAQCFRLTSSGRQAQERKE